MNARERIAQSLRGVELDFTFPDGSPAQLTEHEAKDLADAVLSVLPDLLTDPKVIEAAVAAMDWRYPSGSARVTLQAAAKALTEGGTP